MNTTTSSLFNAIEKHNNHALTENGDSAYKSTLDACLDLFYHGPDFRKNVNSEEFYRHIVKSYNESPINTLRILAYLRDFRDKAGQGERDVFRKGLEIFINLDKDTVISSGIIPLIPFYGRWDDMFYLIGRSYEIDNIIYEIISKQFIEDCDAYSEGKSVSLLAKWLPSVNTSSKKTVALAKKIIKALGVSEKSYRKTLSMLRSHINILEKKLSNNQFDFDYSTIPSRAKMIHSGYGKVFNRKDNERYSKHVSDLANAIKNGSNDVKTNVKALYPYEIIKSVRENRYCDDENTHSLMDSNWKSLPNYFGEKSTKKNWLAVVDNSGSMTMGNGQAMNVALSLGIYIAERNAGIFKNQMITFSAIPHFLTLNDAWNITEKVNYILRREIIENTNLRAVFDLVLDAAVEHNIPVDEMPEAIVIISDMQFDSGAVGDTSESTHNYIKKKYTNAGYPVPKLVYWNASAYHHPNIPVTKDANGVVLVGGCKPGMFEQILKSKGPVDFMLDIINSERYSLIKNSV